MKSLTPNTLLQNRYLIVQLIGKGGMGEVYLAVDQRLGSAVAIKRTFFSDDETLGSAFEREARTLARLRHAALPKVSDHFTENETQYLVMEHISGEDLSGRLEASRKPFPLNWVLFWADQLLDALAYLHAHEPPIIHRDIKPQNLKLTNENHIILLDFGLAKNTAGGQSRISTTGGSIVGYTPHYAPMEQIRGTGTTAKSDIYSLAATLYQLLTAQVPPDALTRADSLLNSLPDPVEPIDKINPEVPRAVSDVIFKGMALSMDARYGSAREMQKALREAYAQLQNKMAAETMAFNLPNSSTSGAIAPQSRPQQQQQQQQQQQIEQQFGAPPLVSRPPQTPIEKYDSLSSSAKRTNSFGSAGHLPPQQLQQQPDFDLTLRDEKMPNPVSLSSSPPSQQKTEVLPSGISSPTREENFNAEATVPLISFGQSAAAPVPEQPAAAGTMQQIANFNSNPTPTVGGRAVGNQPQHYGSPLNTASASAATGASSRRTQTENVYQPAAGAPLYTAEAKSKSGRKGLAAAGIIGGLALSAVAATGIGFYAFGDRLGINGGANVTPTPAASPIVTATPAAAPTVERAIADADNAAVDQTVAAEENAEPANSNVAEKINRTTRQASQPSTASAPASRTAVSPPARAAQTSAPPNRTAPPAVVRTPRPATATTTAKPKPGGRTDILQ